MGKRKTFSILGSTRVVKMLVISLFVFAPFQWVGAQVTLNKGNTTLGAVINQIQKQTKYKFFYDDEIAATKVAVVSVKNASVQNALNSVLRNHDITYTIEDNVVYLKKGVKKSVKAAPATTAQQGEPKKAIKGTILDENGDPMIGAVVEVKGTNDKAITDIDGNYTVYTSDPNPVVSVSYLGYKTKEVAVRGNAPVDISMVSDAKALNEVVVTALGIRKEAKALSYNVQQVNSDEITGVKDANFMNALAGKVAGVQISASSSGIGGGVQVVMRGAKSLSKSNNALYVVDGIPMPSLEGTQPSDYFSGMGQSGDGAAMINPEDIESMSVLSGAAASALYGSEAQNGVIMIKTKRGQKGRTSLSYTNNTSFFSPFVMPEFQNTYGAANGEFRSWGAKMGKASSYDPEDFFQTGYNVSNAVTLSTGNEKNQTFLSLASTNAEGIVDNNKLDRYNFAIRNTSSMLNDKLTLDLAAMYMNVREQNMIAQGQYMNPIVPVYLMSPSYSLDTYKLYEMYNEERNFKTQYWPWGNQGVAMQNPYWEINRDMFVNHKNRYMFSAGATYEIMKGLSISGRAKLDYTTAKYETKYYASTDAIFAGPKGKYGLAHEDTRQIYGDLMLNYDKYFGDFSLNGNIGASIKDVRYDYNSNIADLNSVPNHFTMQQAKISTMETSQAGYHEQVQAIFATAQVGWRSALYLDLTSRIDWASALAGTDKKALYYPSVGVSAILTELIPGLKNEVLSFLKIRGSYSEVGNAAPRFVAYQTHPYVKGIPTTLTTYPNSDIKPERTKGWELGLQANLWNDKVNLNVSLYKTSTYNQLFNPALAPSAGYSSIYINGGQVDNKGIELSLTLNQPLGPVDWSSTFTYTLNRNKIKKLLDARTLANGYPIEQDHLDLISIGSATRRLVQGGTLGDIYVTTLARDYHGNVIVDYVENTVSRDMTAGPLEDGFVYAGSTLPKYNMGWRNSFSWKGITLGCLVTARVGGIGVSMTQALMDYYGVSKTTAQARDAGGVMINGAMVPAAQKYYSVVGAGVGENYVYSMTNVRLAELSLGYDVPISQWVPWIKGLNVAFTGRNLLMLYCKAPFDPEQTAASGSVFFDGLDYFMQPSLRNLGFSVKVNF